MLGHNTMIHIHPPRTGGTALYLSKPINYWSLYHNSLRSIEKHYTIQDYLYLYSYAPDNVIWTVRNPFDRLVSMYCFFKYQQKYIEWSWYSTFNEFLKEVIEDTIVFPISRKPNLLSLSQISFITSDGSDNINNIVGSNIKQARFENIKMIAKVLPSNRPFKHYSKYYKDWQIRAIEDKYCTDLEYLGYSFEDKR